MEHDTSKELENFSGKWVAITIAAWFIFAFGNKIFGQDLSLLRFLTPPLSITAWIIYRTYYSNKWRYDFKDGPSLYIIISILFLMLMYALNSYFDDRFDTKTKQEMVKQCFAIQEKYKLPQDTCDELEIISLKKRKPIMRDSDD